MKQQNKSYLFAILAVIGWSTAATAFKITLKTLDVFQMLFYSTLVSTMVLGAIMIFQGKAKKIGQFSVKDFAFSALLGLLNPFIYYIILFKAYDLLPAQEAQPLNYIWPVMLVLLSVPILKQKINLKTVLAILISFCGVIVIATRGDLASMKFSEPLGTGLALSTAIIWALYWLLNTKDKKDSVVRLFMNFVFGSIYIIIATYVFSDLQQFNAEGLFGATWIGIFEMGLTFVLWSLALKLTDTTAKISQLIFLTPFLSLMLIALVLKEQITWSTIIGLILIVIGIAWQQFTSNKSKKNRLQTTDD